MAEKASSDGTTNKQCRAAHRQSTRMTIIKVDTDFADIPKPTLSQRPAVAAEEARTVGTVNVQCRSDDQDYTMTIVVKSPTDFVKITESTPSRVSPVVAKEAHTDGTRVVQCQSDDQNFMKTTIMQMPMDYLEIPEPSLPRGFLEACTKCGSYDSSRYLYREDTTHFCWVTLPSGPVGPSWPLEQDRAVGFVRIGYK